MTGRSFRLKKPRICGAFFCLFAHPEAHVRAKTHAAAVVSSSEIKVAPDGASAVELALHSLK